MEDGEGWLCGAGEGGEAVGVADLGGVGAVLEAVDEDSLYEA